MNARAKPGLAAPVEDWRTLLVASSPSIPALERTIAGLHAEAQAAETTVARLRDARRAILLSGTDDELKAHDDQAGVASRTIERSRAAIEELELKLAEARAAKQDGDRRVAYDAAADQVTAVRARLQAEYPKAVTIVRSLLRALAEAETARLSTNAERPVGADLIPSAEDFRNTVTVPAKTVSKQRVMLWINPATDMPFNGRDQDIIGDDGKGASRLDPPVRHVLRQRAFERVTFYPEETVAGLPDLSTVIDLPALYPGDASGYRPPLIADGVAITRSDWQRMVTSALDRYEAPTNHALRLPVHELHPVED
ncbi:hypothetical protein [Lichenifustis flavocetrariae]|uniref:Uncharacterized protein n=1 Tax=Lichenifustis flavocetrariae TaxID=2949735 RepID=A0AA41Z5E6_9HYPH|nr:hypothetical protein [Lichenifustis flavocetrariae]MCW6513110.1 hypothetical protein [Lichenifustis flavocetrariae]